jgi:predicted trehalose synthase
LESRSFQSYRIRLHSDFHLGQVLFNPSNNDYTIIGFEGEQLNDAVERRLKHSPMKDVAGMMRSFHYVASLTQSSWFECVHKTFLHSFLKHSSSLWIDPRESDNLLLFHLLERTVHELVYEMNYRPQWIDIPLYGLGDVINKIEKRQQSSIFSVESNN